MKASDCPPLPGPRTSLPHSTNPPARGTASRGHRSFWYGYVGGARGRLRLFLEPGLAVAHPTPARRPPDTSSVAADTDAAAAAT